MVPVSVAWLVLSGRAWKVTILFMSLSLALCRFTELDCLVDGHKHLLEDVQSGERNSIMLLKRGEVHVVMPVLYVWFRCLCSYLA